MREKSKAEKAAIALFLAPEVIALIAIVVSGLIYLFLN